MPTQNTNANANAMTATELQAMLEQYPNASLRKIAIACEISYNWILKCAKEPIVGVPFDPTATNYEKVAGVFAKRGIDLHLLDWEELNVPTVRKGAALTKDMDAFQVGGKVYLREDNTVPFEICYKTETHIVIMKEGTTEPRAWSHATFLMKGPSFEPRTVTEKTPKEETETTEQVEESKPAKKSRKSKKSVEA